MLGTQVSAIRKNSVEVVTKEGSETIPADPVVLAIGYNPSDRLYKEINSTAPKRVWLLRDAKSCTNIMFAIKDGEAG